MAAAIEIDGPRSRKWFARSGPKPASAERKSASPGGLTSAEPLTRLTRSDWMFVFFAWLTTLWAVFIVVDGFSNDGSIGFDFLPVVAGIPIVLAGWPALRVRERVLAAVDGLSGGAGLDVTGDITAFRAALRGRVRLWSLACGAAIAIGTATNFAWMVIAGLYELGTTASSIFFFVLLVSVVVGAGFAIGFLLGRVLGYGHILPVMRDTGIAITRIDTPQARAAIRRMEDVLRYAFVVTLVMCHWFALWFAVWLLGFNLRDYRSIYWVMFIVLWIVAFGFYLLAARAPSLAFRRHIDGLRGGVDGQAARARQLREAEEDRDKLSGMENSDRQSFDEGQELNALIEELHARCAPSRLPPPWLLNLLAVWIALLLLGSLVFSLRNSFAEAPPTPSAASLAGGQEPVPALGDWTSSAAL